MYQKNSEHSFFVTMGVLSLYIAEINIIMRKLQKIVYKKQEKKNTKTTPSFFIRNLILIIFKQTLSDLAMNNMWFFAQFGTICTI